MDSTSGIPKKKKLYKRDEQATKNVILQWISLHPQHGFAWPNNTTGVYRHDTQCYVRNNSKFFIRGVSDVLGIWKGRPLFIEVKSPTGKLSPFQIKFLERAERYGAIVIVATSLSDVVERLSEYA